MLPLWFAAHTLLWPINIQIGDNALGLNTVLLSTVGILWIGFRLKTTRLTIKAACYLAIFLFLSCIFALIGPCEDKIFKLFASAPLLFILICVGFEIGIKSKPSDWLKLRKTALWILVIAALFIVLEFFLPDLFSPEKAPYHKAGKYSGLYSEPSLVAISLFPCIAVLLSSPYKKNHRQGLASLLFLLVCSRSSTLIVMTICYAIYRIIFSAKIIHIFRYSIATVGIIAIAAYFNYNALIAPTVDRITSLTKSSDQHLSSLIYIKGWQDAWDNLIKTKGLGLGFNMMGCTPLPDVPARNLLSKTPKLDLNNDDGSFLFSKIVSETGLLGLLFYIGVAWSWIAHERKVRIRHGTTAVHIASVQTSFMFSFVISSLVRSTGYFQGGGLLWLTAAVAAFSYQRNRLMQTAIPKNELDAPIN